MQPIPIPKDNHTPEELEQFTRNCKAACRARRLQAVAMVLRGARRSAAGEAQGMEVESLRDWVEWFHRDGPEGLRLLTEGGLVGSRRRSWRSLVRGWMRAVHRLGSAFPLPLLRHRPWVDREEFRREALA